MFLNRWRNRRGQSTTEYILIVVLVAVLSIGVITVFGNQIRELFRISTERIGGNDAATMSPYTGPGSSKSISDLKTAGDTAPVATPGS